METVFLIGLIGQLENTVGHLLGRSFLESLDFLIILPLSPSGIVPQFVLDDRPADLKLKPRALCSEVSGAAGKVTGDASSEMILGGHFLRQPFPGLYRESPRKAGCVTTSFPFSRASVNYG
jgi:hypothetical protein